MEWKPFRHPTLGDVEIGGFHPKFFSQNGPPRALEHWAGNQARFNLEMALHLPELKDPGVAVRQIAQEGDSTTYEVTVRYTNAGRLPTSLRQAQLVKIVRPDRVELAFEDALTSGDDPSVRVVSPYGDEQQVGITEPAETKTVRFQVRTYGVPGARGTYRVLSTRGGILRGEFTLGTPPG
jgi:hypothetical protein